MGKEKPRSHEISGSGKLIHRSLYEIDRGVSKNALRRNARSHQADGSERALQIRQLLVLHQDRRRQTVSDVFPRQKRQRRRRAIAARSKRAGEGIEILRSRRFFDQRRRQPARLFQRLDRLSPVHAPGQGSAHRAIAARQGRARHVGRLGERQQASVSGHRRRNHQTQRQILASRGRLESKRSAV
mgnify:CR=1 FL=1